MHFDIVISKDHSAGLLLKIGIVLFFTRQSKRVTEIHDSSGLMLERSLPLRTSAGMSLLKILGLSSSLGLASLSLSSASTTQLASSTANRQHRTCILLQQTRDYHSTIAGDIASICWSRKQLSMVNRQHRVCILLQQTRYNHSTIADYMQALAVAAETSWGQSPPMSCSSSEDLRDWLISCWRRRRIEDVKGTGFHSLQKNLVSTSGGWSSILMR